MARCKDCGIELVYDEDLERYFPANVADEDPSGAGEEHEVETWDDILNS